LGSKFVEAGEMLHVAEAFIGKNYHPTVICRGNVTSAYGSSFLLVANHFLLMICASFIWSTAYNKALEDAIAVLDQIAMPIDVKDRKFF
jgi:T-complex protein 1 subunit gamma